MYIEAAQYIKDKSNGLNFNVGLILGSGLGEMAECIENPIIINYDEIKGFPKTSVSGHRGRFVMGNYEGKDIIIMQGRFHYYEGFNMDEVVMPVRVLKSLGIETLIVTNAAGGINEKLAPGDLMIITDHINFSGINPLRGKNFDDLGPRFPDMTYAYNKELSKKLIDIAKDIGISIHEGVYAMMAGPSYETPAEIKMLRMLGADAVGMSTVPEVITAVHSSIKVVGVSCISNYAAGVIDQPLDHLEVLETAEKVKNNFINLLSQFISNLD